ncbi:SDR family oxidoreductase [Pseudonocardia spinosispora]|uniref:SDR family oxidoreductase n=1 Tax=Pseudonocardia spinosispora TaxID=103441 RepID=UPI00041EA092|nr:SDR family oxidoreductase [Pseudonocardia spinosispora]
MRLFGQPRYPSIDPSGAVVAITGGARGIGQATAREFIGHGAVVAIGDLDVDAASAAAAELGERAAAFELDVTRIDSFTAFLKSVTERFGPIDVLVNNAGVMPIAPFLDEPDTLTDTILNVNVRGPINGMRLVVPGMIERGRGHVVNIASVVGRGHIPGLAVYCASKHAIVGLTETVRAEVARTGVSVSAILPTMVGTEAASGIDIPPVGMVEPADVARAVLHSLRTRRAEIAVPRWIGALATGGRLLPEGVQRTARRLIRDDRGFAANAHPARAAYLERLGRQTSTLTDKNVST